MKTLTTISPNSLSETELSIGKMKVVEQGKYIRLEITKSNPSRTDSILIPQDSYKTLLQLIEESYYKFFYPTNNVTITKEIEMR